MPQNFLIFYQNFPIFSSKTMNSEIYKLKLHITDYLYAIKHKDVIHEK